LHALHDAFAVGIEAGNNAARQGHLRPWLAARSTKLASTRAPASPDFSG
jgi:hypothetical protein